MMLTLRQHGPHMTPLKKLPPPYDKPLFPGKFKPKDLDDWLNLNLGNYLQRLAGSDADDHAPRKDIARRRASRRAVSLRRSPAVVRRRDPRDRQNRARRGARLELRHVLHAQDQLQAGARRIDYAALDLSFAGALILDVAGVPKDAFFQANALLRERCKGFYLDCENRPMLDSYHNYIFHEIERAA